MRYLTQEEYNRKLDRLRRANIQKEYRKALSDEKKKYSLKLKLETSKMIAVYLFILLNVIIAFAMISMWKFADLSYLGVLISDIAAQVIIYAIYCMKAYKAKKSEEEMKYLRDQQSDTIEDVLSAGAESNEYVPVNGNVETFTYSNGNNIYG